MGFTLSDIQNKDMELRVNAWNWRPTIELIRVSGILDDQLLNWMAYNAEAEITQEQAKAIGTYIQQEILPSLDNNTHIDYDLNITSEIDTFELHREDLQKNYNINPEWLAKFVHFCFTCNGFKVL